jgi:hypothetical protein
MGVAADVSFYEMYKDVAKTQAAIAAVFANINLVYQANFNVFLEVQDVIIQTTTGGPTWNNKPATPGGHCSIGIEGDLNAISSWRQSNYPKKNALWHLMTNCFPPAGTIGLAWIAVLCNTARGTAVTSYSQNFWVTVAHEIGHNFGGNHAFQLGQGRTGGPSSSSICSPRCFCVARYARCAGLRKLSLMIMAASFLLFRTLRRNYGLWKRFAQQ